MPVDDLWYQSRPGSDGKRVPTERHGRGKRWRVRYVDGDGRDRARLFERRADADRHDVLVRADVNRGLWVDPASGRVTVADYWPGWAATQLHADSTQIKVRWAFERHVEPTALGRMTIGHARRSHVQGWATDRARVLAPSTLHEVYVYLSSMFRSAALDRAIASSPCQDISLPDLIKPERFIATPQQIDALADAFLAEGRSTRHFHAQPYVAAGTGLRQGEVWGLELEHVDFLRREIHVRQQLKTIVGRKPFLAPPKSAMSRRTVELPDVTAQALAEHLRRYPVKEVEIDDETDPRRHRRRKARFVFLNAEGRPFHRGSWSAPWTKAVAAVDGLPKGYTMHALRHYYATLLIHNGASVTTVQRALGHSKPTITLNTYAGEWPDQEERTRTLVDGAFKAARAARAQAG